MCVCVCDAIRKRFMCVCVCETDAIRKGFMYVCVCVRWYQGFHVCVCERGIHVCVCVMP